MIAINITNLRTEGIVDRQQIENNSSGAVNILEQNDQTPTELPKKTLSGRWHVWCGVTQVFSDTQMNLG